MLAQQTADKLRSMRLNGMAEAFMNQITQPANATLSFEERLGLLVDYEWTHRQNRRLARLLKNASFKLQACMEDIDYHHPRGLDRAVVESLSSCQWILSSQNVIVTGPTGSGKTYLACALGTQACRQGLSAKYYQVSKLLSNLHMAKGDGTYPKLLNTLAKTDLIILDDFGLAPLNAAESRDILEIIDDRSQRCSTIVAAQLPIEHWYDRIADPTVADAILDRLVHNAHKLNLKLKGESMRKVLNQP
jgi:DNA replication protein DnaC